MTKQLCAEQQEGFEDGQNCILIRLPVEEYLQKNHTPTILNIGSGHIFHQKDLNPIYQDKGGYDMIASVPHCQLHENQYTVSIEAGLNFGSDLVGDFTDSSIRSSLLQPQSWDLIIDETFMWVFMRDDVLADIPASLKPGGVLVTPFQVHKFADVYMPGWTSHNEQCPITDRKECTFDESLNRVECASEFANLKELHQYVEKGMQNLGFSKVSLCPGIISNVVMHGLDGFSLKEIAAANQSVQQHLFDSHPELRNPLHPEYPLAQLHPHFECMASHDYILLVAKVPGDGPLPDVKCDL